MEHKTKAYSCKIFTVWEEDVQLVNDKKTRQSWIDHQPTVAVIAVNKKNELLLISQYRIPTKDQLLEIPAGSIDDGESPADCAQRELAEETGFRSGQLTELYAGYLLPGYCNEYMYFFLPKISSRNRFLPTRMNLSNCNLSAKPRPIICCRTVI